MKAWAGYTQRYTQERDMHDLRFIERNGEKILQKLIMISADQEPYYGRSYNRKYKWIDVPLVEETEYENKPGPLVGGA